MRRPTEEIGRALSQAPDCSVAITSIAMPECRVRGGVQSSEFRVHPRPFVNGKLGQMEEARYDLAAKLKEHGHGRPASVEGGFGEHGWSSRQ